VSDTRFVEANGVRFAYLEQGEGPLVLLVHGFPDTARSWDATRAALADAGFRAVSPWTRGYHPTEVPADGRYDSDTLGRDLLALIEALGEDQAIVVGHDWGASAAYSAAGLSPDRIAKLVTIAIPHPAAMVPTPRLLYAVRHFVTLRLPGAAARIRRGDFATIDELVRRWSPSWNPPASETADVKASFAEPGCLEAALGYYRALTPILPRSQRSKLTVPAVAFAGRDDILDPSWFERAAPRYAAGYEVVNMAGGHFMHREHPEHFIGELLRVLR
jgi:pimeloyl-ACP methyl ester carboxylesterase